MTDSKSTHNRNKPQIQLMIDVSRGSLRLNQKNHEGNEVVADEVGAGWHEGCGRVGACMKRNGMRLEDDSAFSTGTVV